MHNKATPGELDPAASAERDPPPPAFSASSRSSEPPATAAEASLALEASPTSEVSLAPRTAAPSPKHVLLATWLGGVFDGMDSSIFALVLYPALSELCGTTSHAKIGEFGSYIVAMFMVGWALGAFFFGTLADYIGRARTLTITILLYAICTGLCAFAHNWWELGFLRFLVGAGIGGELGIGAVFLAECWPGKNRYHAMGLMGTSLGFGYFLTAGLNLWLGHIGWRYLFLAGIAPAFLTVYIRAKLKESEQFVSARATRQRLLQKPVAERTADDKQSLRFSILRLFDPEHRRNALMVSALSCVAIICWWAVLGWIPAWINQLTGALAVEQRSHAMFAKDTGMILSGICGGIMVKRFGYRFSMSVSMFAAFFAAVGMFMLHQTFTPTLLAWIFALGFFGHVPFVILWMYIPELFAAHMRSTAFGCSYNIGRLAAAGAVLVSGAIIARFNGSYAIAGSTIASAYIAGAILAIFMPKTAGDVK